MAPMDQRFDTLAQFVDWLVKFQGEHSEEWTPLWFRGHPDRALELKPRMLRDKFVAGLRCPRSGDETEEALERAEQEINRQFRREAASLLSERSDLVESYFLAQHHGLPTRLLDWTTNGLAALFFTVIKRPEKDGEVIVTTPTWRLTAGEESHPHAEALRGAPFPQRHALVVETVEYLFGEGERPERPLVVPVLPDLRSQRMLQQGACFTLHAPGSGAIREEAVTRMTIPSARKPDFVRALRMLGISWSTLFPDLDHVCREIGIRWQDEEAY